MATDRSDRSTKSLFTDEVKRGLRAQLAKEMKLLERNEQNVAAIKDRIAALESALAS